MMRSLVCAMLAACAASAHPTPSSPSAAATTDDDPSCPMGVPGTSVTVEDTERGAALVFVTTGDVAQVRARAKTLAADLAAGRPTGHGMSDMITGASGATASDVERGARVGLVAPDAGAIQAQIRMHAQHLASGSCKMAM
jgi:hypothetical protein